MYCMIFNNELNISLMKFNVFKHLIVCSVLALSNTTNSSIQTSIIKLNVHVLSGEISVNINHSLVYVCYASLV